MNRRARHHAPYLIDTTIIRRVRAEFNLSEPPLPCLPVRARPRVLDANPCASGVLVSDRYSDHRRPDTMESLIILPGAERCLPRCG
jgi:hypothetical protein